MEEAWPFTVDPSPRAIGTERGCVEDQPQRAGSSQGSGACSVLRLVEDDTAALLNFARQLILIVGLSAASADGRAESVTLLPIADTSIFAKDPTNNLGAAQSLTVGNTATLDPVRALVKFAIAAAVPTNALVLAASLELSVVRVATTNPATFDLHRLLVDWGEGSKGAGSLIGVGDPATAGEATWLARFHPDTFWSIRGGGAGSDYAAAPSAAADVASEAAVVFPSSSNLVADVQGWLQNPAANFGWLIKDRAETVLRSARRFGSREEPTNPPRLLLEYELLQPRISGAQIVGNQFCLQFLVKPGKAYVVERRVLVDSGLWTAITNLPPAATNESVRVCDPLATGSRFYRVGER